MVDAAECDSDIEELRESYGSLQMLTADETGDHLLQSDSPAEGLTTRCWATYGNAISRDCYRAPAKCLQHPAKGLVESNATLWTLFFAPVLRSS